jgi:predicted DCC family thiol-disulfide oxidoreductase YuxK
VTNGWTGGQYSVFRFVLGAYLAIQFPSLVWWFPVNGVIALALAVGAFDRSAAVLFAVDVFVAADLAGVDHDPSALALAFLLLAHACIPGKPYGSFAARGRADPAGDWRMPPLILLTLRIATAVVWIALLRPPFPELSGPAVLLLLASLDPGWLPPRRDASPATLFYDGECGLCHRAVRFVLAEDPDGRAFRFAPLASEAFTRLVPEPERSTLPDSLVVRTPDGRILVRAGAVREIGERLGGLWRALALASRAVPTGLLDRGYDQIARMRSRFFARPAEACPLVPAELRRRFD